MANPPPDNSENLLQSNKPSFAVRIWKKVLDMGKRKAGQEQEQEQDDRGSSQKYQKLNGDHDPADGFKESEDVASLATNKADPKYRRSTDVASVATNKADPDYRRSVDCTLSGVDSEGGSSNLPPGSENDSRTLSLPKVNKLGVFLRALDDLITEEDKTELGTQLGGDVFAKLMDLHYSVHRSDVALRSEKDFIDSSSIVGRPVSGFSISSWKANVPAFAQFTTFPFIPSSITAWKLEEIPKTLPPLPEILDPTLETSAFTHIGVGGGRAIDLNYERLEFLGDSFIHLLSSLFISKTFPHFTPGKSSQLRQRLIQNTQLCQYSHQYNFGARARFPAGFLGSATDQEKIFADIFEAYIAAVILSDPAHGLERATQWLKGIWGRTIIRDIRAEGKKGAEFDSPIWNLRGRDATIEIVSSSQAPLNAKEELQKKLQSKDAKIKYEDLGPERYNKVTKQPLFTVGVYMDGYGERKQLGWGTATGKKDAGMKAAEMALKNGALMKYYVDKKNLQAKMDQQEAEALAEM